MTTFMSVQMQPIRATTKPDMNIHGIANLEGAARP